MLSLDETEILSIWSDKKEKDLPRTVETYSTSWGEVKSTY